MKKIFKKCKQALSIMLAAAMVVTLAPGMVSAEELVVSGEEAIVMNEESGSDTASDEAQAEEITALPESSEEDAAETEEAEETKEEAPAEETAAEEAPVEEAAEEADFEENAKETETVIEEAAEEGIAGADAAGLVSVSAIELSKEHMALTYTCNDDYNWGHGQLYVLTTPADADCEIEWTSSDKAVATVDDYGVVYGQGEGLATITAKVKGSEPEITAACEVGVGWKYLSNLGMWMQDIDDEQYMGTAITPYVYLHDGLGYSDCRQLYKGTDYTVTYKNNINAGKADIIITGKGDYTGSETVSFYIFQRDITDTYVNVRECYEGSDSKEIKPLPDNVTFTSWYTGKKFKLKNGTDYTVAYRKDDSEEIIDSIPKGESGGYYMIVTGKGNYCGSDEERFRVAGVKNDLFKATVTFKNGENKKKYSKDEAITFNTDNITVKCNGKILSYGTDYELYYDENPDAGTQYLTIQPAEGSDYTGYKTVSYTVAGTPISKVKIEGFTAKIPFTGEYAIPEIKLKDGTKELVEYEDYCCYPEHGYYGVGKNTLVIDGLGGYTGTVRKAYQIVPTTLDKLNPDDMEIQLYYNDKPISVSYNKDKQIWEADDKLEYTKGGAAPSVNYIKYYCDPYGYAKFYESWGKPSYVNSDKITEGETDLSKRSCIKIPCKGSDFLKDTITVYYDIKKAELSYANCDFAITDTAYKDKAGNFIINPVITDHRSAKKLVAGKDYDKDIKYFIGDELNEEITDKKTKVDKGVMVKATIKASENGNYSGSCDVYYAIVSESLSKAKITVKDQELSGWAVPDYDDVTVTLNGKEIAHKETIDDEVIENYVITEIPGVAYWKAGTKKIRIDGIGPNYCGSKIVTYKVKAKPIKWWWQK